ncbi:MAG: PTS sugar transporter subunit IIA [candidate division WOR-3 bacterium]
MISLAPFVRPELAFDVPAVRSQHRLFEVIAEHLARHHIVSNQSALVQQFEKREQLCSTGVGHGVALPHAQTEAVDRIVVVVCRLRHPLNWQSRDGEPVRLVVAIVSPPNLCALYLKVLAVLARALHEETVRNQALLAETPVRAAEVIAASAQELQG